MGSFASPVRLLPNAYDRRRRARLGLGLGMFLMVRLRMAALFAAAVGVVFDHGE